ARALDISHQISQYGHNIWRIQDGYLPGVPEVITQTTDGYIWIGTYSGLVRFDGVRFVPWVSEHGEQLPDYRIYALLGARDGSLWIGTPGGFARWKSGALTVYTSIRGRVNGFVEDLDGNIWFIRSSIPDGDKQGPLCRLSGNDVRC